jgi:hypothetical protein
VKTPVAPSNRLFLVLSGAYAAPELCAELGRLPPSFLPLGSERLFGHQLRVGAALGGRIVLSLPQDFVIDAPDAERLAEVAAEVVRVPAGLTLAQSLAYVLQIAKPTGPLHVLHGDTLVEVSDWEATDVVATAPSDDYYPWADVIESASGSLILQAGRDSSPQRIVACGYFAFSDPAALLSCLSGTDDFLGAINLYSETCPLSQTAATRWLDFGHLPLFYQSRRELLVGRVFNQVTSDGLAFTKRSSDVVKMQAEMQWYRSVPDRLRAFVPQFLGPNGEDSYSLEYMYLPTLSDLAVFGRLPPYVWGKILDNLLEFVDLCGAVAVPDGIEPAAVFSALVGDKTRSRLLTYLHSIGEDESSRFVINGHVLPPIGDLLEDSLSAVTPTGAKDLAFIHGDLFFGNIMFDFRARRCKVIDPRGRLGDTLSSYGDRRYDIAKLAHSVMGRYDALLMGYCEFAEPEPRSYELSFYETSAFDFLQARFRDAVVVGQSCWSPDIARLTAMLFLSAPPLHGDDPVRQRRLFANGLRILAELEAA